MSKLLPDGEITVKEYNEKYSRERDAASLFLHNLEHAVQKGGAYEETMRQLSFVGWPECRETLKTALGVYSQVLKGKLVGGHPSSEFRHVVLCGGCEYFNPKVDGTVGFCTCGEVAGSYPKMRVVDDFCSYGRRKAQEG